MAIKQSLLYFLKVLYKKIVFPSLGHAIKYVSSYIVSQASALVILANIKYFFISSYTNKNW